MIDQNEAQLSSDPSGRYSVEMAGAIERLMTLVSRSSHQEPGGEVFVLLVEVADNHSRPARIFLACDN